MCRSLLFMISLAPLLSLPACSQSPSSAPPESQSGASAPVQENPVMQENPVNETPVPAGKSMDEVQEEHQKRLLAIPGVVGMGQGLSDGKPCFRVYVDKLTPELSARIPTTIERYPVVVIQTGPIRKF
jgi:hypothetical protein